MTDKIILLYSTYPVFVSWPIIFVANVILFFILKGIIPAIWGAITDSLGNKFLSLATKSKYFDQSVYEASVWGQKSLKTELENLRSEIKSMKSIIKHPMVTASGEFKLVKFRDFPTILEFENALCYAGIRNGTATTSCHPKFYRYTADFWQVTLYPDRIEFWGVKPYGDYNPVVELIPDVLHRLRLKKRK